MTSTERFHLNERGASAVEFALIAPVLLFMLFGMLVFGIWISASHTIEQVASGAARASVAGHDPDEREQMARSYIASHLAPDALVNPDLVQIDVETDPVVPGTFRVIVTYDASELPIWDLIGSTLLPAREIRRETIITTGGL